MGCNNAVGQNSFEIEQFEVGLLEFTYKIFSISLYFFIPLSNFKLLYLRTILIFRDVIPHFGNLRNRILPYAVS